jgi:hypothetical protein
MTLLLLTLQAAAAPPGAPPNINNYPSIVTGSVPTNIQMYFNNSGEGWLFDGNKNKWVKIPEIPNVQINYCKTSNTMALIYAWRHVAVYDTTKAAGYEWNITTGTGPHNFYSYTRSKDAPFVAQINNNLAMASGTNMMMVYDFTLHRWVQQDIGSDDSTDTLAQNFVLTPQFARIKQLNGPFHVYNLGAGRWNVGQ